MRIKEEYKVREMAGEHIVVMQGRYGVDMTKVIALTKTATRSFLYRMPILSRKYIAPL